MSKPALVFTEFGMGISGPRIDSGIKRKETRSIIDSEVYDVMTEYYKDMKKGLSAPTSTSAPTTNTIQLPDISRKGKHVQIMITSPRDEYVDKDDDVEILRLPAAKPSETLRSAGVSSSSFGSSQYDTMSESCCVSQNNSILKNDKRSIRPKSTPGATRPGSDQIQDQQIFVKVELLQAKDVFGVNTLKFVEHEDSNMPSVSLVSKGAEIIMLAKRLFLKHADERVRKTVLNSIRYYPRETTLQENLQRKVDWEQYRQTVIQDTLNNHKRCKTMSGLV